MSTRVRLTVIIFVCFALATVPLAVTANDGFEPNDDFSTATEITSGTYSGELVSDEDDYYRLPAEAGDTIQVVATVPKKADGNEPDNDPDLILTDSDGFSIDYDDERTSPASSTTEHVVYYQVKSADLSGGNYVYLNLEGTLDRDTTATYDLDVQRNANDQFESNGDIGQAAELDPGTYTGLTLLDDESDYYALDVQEGDTLDVEMIVPKADDDNSPDNDPDLDLLDGDGNTLDYAVEQTTNTRDDTSHIVKYEAETTETIYIHAHGNDDSEIKTDYTLSVQQSANDRFEANGNISTATPLTPGSYENLTLLDNENDYYEIPVREGGTLDVEMVVPKADDDNSPDNDPDLELVDGDGDTLESSDTWTTDTRDNTSHIVKYEAQTTEPIYIRAHGIDDSEVDADYRLSVQQNANDRFEANGNISTATPLTPGTYDNLTLLDEESDYYAVEIEEGGTLDIRMDVPKASDGGSPENRPDLTLVDSNGDVLDYGVDQTTDTRDNTSHIVKYEAETTGPIYVHAHGDDNREVETDYTLSVKRSANDRFEANGDISTATDLDAGSYENLTLLDDESDYYAVNVKEGGTLDIKMDVPKADDDRSPDNDPDLDLVDSDGNDLDNTVIRTSDSRDNTSHLVKYEAETTETIYIHAHGNSDAEVETDYTLSVQRSANDRFEANGNISTATGIDADTYGELTILDDESDYYVLPVKEGGTLNVRMDVPKASDGYSPDNDPDLDLVDGDGNTLDRADTRTTDARDNTSHLIKYEAQTTGLIYIHVHGDDDREVETDYTLSVQQNANDRVEPNGNISIATPLGPGSYEDLTLLDEENDYYAVTIEAGGTLNATMDVLKASDGDEPNNNPDLDLRDEGGNRLEYDQTSTDPEDDTVTHTLEYTSDSEQTVYVRPHGSDDETTASYMLSLQGDIQKPDISTDEPPKAAVTVIPTDPAVGESVSFDASDSVDPDGNIVSYEWDVDDDRSYEKTGASISQVFESGGTKTVNLRITDDAGNNDTATVQVSVEDSVASLTSDDVSTPSGTEATVQFGLENTGQQDEGYILNLTLPEGWEISDRTDDGGTWNSNETKWLWETVGQGEQVQPAVTVSVPEDTEGTYSVDGAVLANDGVVDEETVTVSIGSQSVPDAIDENNNGRIGDFEILQAIEYWRTGETVPDTGGQTIDDFDVLDLIETWRSNAEI